MAVTCLAAAAVAAGCPEVFYYPFTFASPLLSLLRCPRRNDQGAEGCRAAGGGLWLKVDPDYPLIQFIHLSCVCACVVLFVKNWPEKYKSENLKGGLQCIAGFWKTVRRGAAVAALQEKWLTDIN